LLPALERLISRGRDSRASYLRWSCESTASLAGELDRLGRSVSPRTVGRVLRNAGYHLEGDRPSSPRTDLGRRFQFVYITRTIELSVERGQPVIAVSLRRHGAQAGDGELQERSAERASRRDRHAPRFAAHAVTVWWQDVGLGSRPAAENGSSSWTVAGATPAEGAPARPHSRHCPPNSGSRSRSAIFRPASSAGRTRSPGLTGRPLGPAGAMRQHDTRSSSGSWSPNGQVRPRAVSPRTRRQMAP
jgi:hypothetical protein